MKELPPAEKAFIWYPYAESPEFPLVGTGGRNAMAGPVFYSDVFKNAARAFPKYYDGKLFTYDWMRGWIMSVTLDDKGNFKSMERFMPSYKFSNPMDMEFAADGDLYVLEYGSGWFTANDDARLVRIEYNGGNRKPAIQLASDKMGGSVPLTVKLSADGTKDADGDQLRYSWKITSKNGYSKTINDPSATVTFDKADVYKATLTVTDDKGAASSQALEISAGNEPPVVAFNLGNNNKSFYFPGKTYNYQVEVSDKEDGSLADGKIKAEQVSVSIDYLAEGFDKNVIAQGHRTADASVNVTKGVKLIESSDCKACHSIDKKSIGPSYRDVAAKYKGKPGTTEYLAKKIISGGAGVWGEVPMSAHPQLPAADASEMAKYIMSLSEDKPKVKTLPVKGSYKTDLQPGDKGDGVYIFRAAYRDRGANGLPSVFAEETLTLRNPSVNPSKYDVFESVQKMSFGGRNIAIPGKHGSYIGMNQVDLTGLTKIEVTALAPKAQLNAEGGIIELRMDSPTGKLLGQTPFIGDNGGGFQAKPEDINIEPATGRHDIYLVFQNPKAKAGQSLMVVTNTEFKTADVGGPQAAQPVAVGDLSAYTGRYIMTGLPFPHIDVSVKDGKLFMKAGDQEGEVKPVGADTFDADGRAKILFLRDENNKVNKLKMDTMGFTFEGPREK
jgi:cytochrome c